MAITYTDPLTGEDVPYPGQVPPAAPAAPVVVDYSGRAGDQGTKDYNPFRSPDTGVKTSLDFKPPPPTNPNVAPLSFTPPGAGGGGLGNTFAYPTNTGKTIKKPDGTEVPNPFGLTAEQIYWALASGNPQAYQQLMASIPGAVGGQGYNDAVGNYTSNEANTLFHQIINYYEPGGGAYNGGGYTAEDTARASYNYSQSIRGKDSGGALLGEKVGPMSPEALAYNLQNNKIVKGADGEYYYPSDPYYTPGVGAGAGTKEGNAYNQGLDYNAAQAQLPGTYTIPGSTLPGGSKYNPPGGGGTTKPPEVKYNSFDAENPWFAKQPVNTEKAAAPVIPGVSNTKPPATTTNTTSKTTPKPTVTSNPTAVNPTIGQMVRTR